MKRKKVDISILAVKFLLLGMILSLLFIASDFIFINKGSIKRYASFSEFLGTPTNIAYIVMFVFALISGFILIYLSIIEKNKVTTDYNKYTVVEKEYLDQLEKSNRSNKN